MADRIRTGFIDHQWECGGVGVGRPSYPWPVRVARAAAGPY